MNKFEKIVLGAGLAAGTYLALKELSESDTSGYEDDSVEEVSVGKSFLEAQEVIDTITKQDVVEWFKAHKQSECKMYLSYLTDNLLDLINLDGTEQLDKEHYLMQWTAKGNGSDAKIMEYRIINFTNMEPVLFELLQKNKGIIAVMG